MVDEATRRTYDAILQCIGRVLRDRNESVIEERIPSRWMQLMKELDKNETRPTLALCERGIGQSKIASQ